MITVKEILEEKGRDVWIVSSHDKVYDALKLMAEKNVGALVVVDAGRVAGIISERDYSRKVILKGKASKKTLVSEIMTPHLYGVHPETTAEECLALMTEKHIRHLPVFEKDSLVGLVSIGDVGKSIMSQQKVMIEHLENYIMGKYQ